MSLTKVRSSIISGDKVNVFDYMTQAQIDDVKARALSLDVTSAIQAAINSFDSSKGGILFFPKGKYLVSDELVIPESDSQYMVPIIFEGEANDLSSYSASEIVYTKTSGVLLQCRGSSGSLTKRFTGAVKNLSLKGPGSVNTADGMNPYDATGMLLDRCVFEDFRYGFNPEGYFYYSQINDCRFADCVYGIYTDTGSWNNATVSKSRVTNCTNLVYLRYYGSNVNFIGCTFEQSTSYGVYLLNGLQASFNNCYFEDCDGAIRFGIDTATTGNNCSLGISDCYFEMPSSASRIVDIQASSSANSMNIDLNNVRCTVPSASSIVSFVRSAYSNVYVSAPNGIQTLTSTGYKDIDVVENATLIGARSPIWFKSSVTMQHGTGSPEGAVSGAVGSLFVRTDGGSSTTLYVKESGTGNTGWAAK